MSVDIRAKRDKANDHRKHNSSPAKDHPFRRVSAPPDFTIRGPVPKGKRGGMPGKRRPKP